MKNKNEPCTASTAAPSNSSVSECPIGVCPFTADLIEAAIVRDAELEALKARMALIEKWWHALVNDIDRYIEDRQTRF
ncbi:hypothetical protein [Desulfopila aestuarii]|uniref:Uncharacterized protein n=1 Tax=Desulfopila aestuarii DSM 18488 TaxID=1121416 RepID=A0A1M7YK49_9BACT|nr:hypothetical protein [Desulfopila aestuarii]SHO52994.1 hypothetical protein SAMN02745220_04876 [Desulfopila aestuarii DSM 18488]